MESKPTTQHMQHKDSRAEDKITGQPTQTICAALVFPSLDSNEYRFMPSLDDFAGESVDFVLFPEGYLDLPDAAADMRKLASDLDAPILVGATGNVAHGRGEILLRFDPDGSDPVRAYTKHSTPGKKGGSVVAFDMPNWNPRDMLPTFELAGVRSGATICHDHYLGLLQHHMSTNGGMRIWLNPSFDNVMDIKWSSVLRLRAVENRVFALCTLHDNLDRRAKTHPFAFSPDGNELCAREAGYADRVPISECTDSGVVYIVDLDISAAGRQLDWSSLPKPSTKKPQVINENPKEPIRVSLKNGQPLVNANERWCDNVANRRIQTEYGGVYVGTVRGEDILDAAKCFEIIYNASKEGCRPIIWNHWDRLPTDADRLANLMMGRSIECCAPIVILDNDGIHELVELANAHKIPVRREIVNPSEAQVERAYAFGLNSAFSMVTDYIHPNNTAAVLDMYRGLGHS